MDEDFEIVKLAYVETYWQEGDIYKFEATVKYGSEQSDKKLKKVFYVDVPSETSIAELYASVERLAKEGIVIEKKNG